MSQTPQKLSGSRAYREAWRAVNLLIRSDGSWSGRERDVCYRNLGDGRFEDVSFVTGLDSAGDGRAWATLDWNGDGALDLALVSRTGPRLQMWQNQAGRSVIVELRGNGKGTNRDAVGAVAELETSAGRRLRRIVQAGAGFLSQSSRRLHFALAAGETARVLRVEWPGGARQEVNGVAVGTWVLRQDAARLEAVPRRVWAKEKQEAAPESVWLVAPVVAPELGGLAKGKKTLLNFWASWCPPCKQEMAEWKSAAGRFAAAGLGVVVASVDEDKTKKPDAPFALLRPSEREVAAWNLWHRHLYERRQDVGLPTSFLLDEEGRVVKVYKGVTVSAAILRDLRAQSRPALPFAGTWHGVKPQRNYVEMATALAEHGLGAESVAFFEAALAQGRASAETLNNYAGGLLELGELEKAEALLLRTLSEYPKQLDALANLGTLRLRQGQAGAARELFRQVLAGEADDAMALHGLGSALFALQDLAGAREALGKAAAIDGENAEYRKSYGSVLAAAGEFGAALREFEVVRAAMPDSVEVANNLGILYVETGETAKGEAELRRAIALAPEAEGGYLNLAMLYARMGKKVEAREVIGRLLAKQPRNQKALEMQEELR